jgi:hypothetical protein
MYDLTDDQEYALERITTLVEHMKTIRGWNNNDFADELSYIADEIRHENDKIESSEAR